MLSGQIDASLEQYPRTGELEEKGYRVLVDCLEIAVDYPNTSYVSTRAFIQKNPDIVKRFLMGISEGIHEFRKNKDEAMRARPLRSSNPRPVPSSKRPMTSSRARSIRTFRGRRSRGSRWCSTR